MQETEVGVEVELTAPSGATSYELTYEWGDVLVGEPTSFTPNSVGIYKLKWDTGKVEFFNSFMPLLTKEEFDPDDTYDELEFDTLERQTRYIIQNYTGQRFGPIYDKNLLVQGDGGQSLVLPVRCIRLGEIVTNYGDDVTEWVEINLINQNIIQKKPHWNAGSFRDIKNDITYNSYEIFSDSYTFTIDGDFGWEYVPGEVEEASRLLITSLIDDDDVGAMRQKGVNALQLGDFSAKLSMDQWGSTGNSTADNLLAEYVDFFVGLV